MRAEACARKSRVAGRATRSATTAAAFGYRPPVTHNHFGTQGVEGLDASQHERPRGEAGSYALTCLAEAAPGGARL